MSEWQCVGMGFLAGAPSIALLIVAYLNGWRGSGSFKPNIRYGAPASTLNDAIRAAMAEIAAKEARHD